MRYPAARVRIRTFAPLLVAGLSFAYLLTFPLAIGKADESHLLYGAKRILDGEVIYRDFFEIITPLAFYLFAAIYRIAGTTLLAARVGMAIIEAARLRAAVPSRAPGLGRGGGDPRDAALRVCEPPDVAVRERALDLDGARPARRRRDARARLGAVVAWPTAGRRDPRRRRGLRAAAAGGLPRRVAAAGALGARAPARARHALANARHADRVGRRRRCGRPRRGARTRRVGVVAGRALRCALQLQHDDLPGGPGTHSLGGRPRIDPGVPGIDMALAAARGAALARGRGAAAPARVADARPPRARARLPVAAGGSHVAGDLVPARLHPRLLRAAVPPAAGREPAARAADRGRSGIARLRVVGS